MNPLRRDTPDSEAVVSSGDEGPWPSSSFGSLPPRRDSSVPGLPGNIWAQGPRGSFSGTANAAQAMYGVRGSSKGRGGPPSAVVRSVSTPSPANSEGSGAPAFASMPLQPTPKAGRSMSHSQGQQEAPQKPLSAGIGAQASALPLGLLAEEVDTESEDEHGEGLTHTISNPPAVGSLQRTSTYPSGYGFSYGVGDAGEQEDDYGTPTSSKFGRKLEHALTSMTLDGPARRPQWHTSLGWDDLPNATESRRHSLADIPTRRGSVAGDDGRPLHDRGPRDIARSRHYDDMPGMLKFSKGDMLFDSAGRTHIMPHSVPRAVDSADKYGLPAQYHVPIIQLEDHEKSQQQQIPRNPGGGPPRKELYIVSFKCARVEVFYLLDNTGLRIEAGDMVVVEADRGQDLGMVQHAKVTPDEARILKRKYAEEQYKWLMMFSVNNQQGAVNPNAPGALGGSNGNSGAAAMQMTSGGAGAGLPPKPYPVPGTMGGPMLNKDDLFNLKPKAIKRIANSNEVRMLMDKEGNEAKAKRTCQSKVNMCRLDMEILDAEWQWDFNKIIFYYYADHYINFQGLITELYRIYKTRIWLSAVNPASFSPAATGQMPQGIGPGAMLGANGYGFAQDPDPHGAVRPYTVGYDTYDPNYPAIPGVQNSFQPTPSNVPQPYSPVSHVSHQFSAVSATEAMNQSFHRGMPTSGYDYSPMHNGFGNMTMSGGNGSPAATSPMVSMYSPPSLTTGSTLSSGPWPNPAPAPVRRESAARAAGIGRQQNPPAPIGTRPHGGASDNAVSPNGNPGYGQFGGFGGGGAGRPEENVAMPRDGGANLTFGSMPFVGRVGGRREEAVGGAGVDHIDAHLPAADPQARMRAFLQNNGATWGR